jgi:hypothetical protein
MKNKSLGGRPKHEAVFEHGQKAQANFMGGMKAILNPSKPAGMLAKRTRRKSAN